MPGDELPTLLYLYGPPAVGKLTVAERVAERTGLALFHNHLSVNAVRPIFGLGTPGFNAVIERLRIDVCATAIAEGTSLIFTNSSAWGGDDGRERFESFAARVQDGVANAGGRTVLVHLTGEASELEGRVGSESRRGHHKLTDPVRLREILASFDASALPGTELTIDTSAVDPEQAAELIAGHVRPGS
ncbi:MAG: hypothetical protein R8F63_10630 [Acidimicrobiales bacterium]|nr:hypothetical protein [Acidimicrobiales bacterium]